ncbi:hypothetical protein ACFLQL_02280 [Verrucomicrobiota bacterium]
MRIENLMKCPMFFPYAGPTDERGWEIKPGKLSGELPGTRFFNELLQRDWKAGKIKIYVNDQDNKIISADCMVDKKDNSLISPVKLKEEKAPTPKATETVPLQEDTNVDEIPLKKKEPIKATKVGLNEYTDKMNKSILPTPIKPPVPAEASQSIKPIEPSNLGDVSLGDLNSQKIAAPASKVKAPKAPVNEEKTGTPNLKGKSDKSDINEIATFMKGPMG